jgi:mRNA-degrading endonuclease toxin of MazEF toxin-antitoxin module
MIRYNKGDVVLVPFPFSDQTTTKKRPAVIISSDTYNDASQDVGHHGEEKRGTSYILFVKRKKQETIKSLKTMS